MHKVVNEKYQENVNHLWVAAKGHPTLMPYAKHIMSC